MVCKPEIMSSKHLLNDFIIKYDPYNFLKLLNDLDYNNDTKHNPNFTKQLRKHEMKWNENII